MAATLTKLLTNASFEALLPSCGNAVASISTRSYVFSFLANLRLFSTSHSCPSAPRGVDKKSALKEKETMKDFGTSGELNLTQIRELPALEMKLTEAEAATEGDAARDLVKPRARVHPLDFMPRVEDYETLYNGKKYKDIPIIFINAGKNNTKVAMLDARELTKAYTSAGIEGFKGCKRGTNIAAQTSGMSFAKRLVRQSKITDVRVVIKGIGPGRVSAIEGLVMGGLNVASITDATPVWGLDQGQGPGPKPRKVRRV